MERESSRNVRGRVSREGEVMPRYTEGGGGRRGKVMVSGGKVIMTSRGGGRRIMAGVKEMQRLVKGDKKKGRWYGKND